VTVAALLAGCAAAPPPVVTAPAPPPAAPGEAAAYATRGVPGYLPYRAVIAAGDGVDDLELFAVYYGLTALGWRATIAAQTKDPVRAANGRPIPVDETLADVDPARYDVLYVPGGAPAADLARRFAAEKTVATTAAGARALAAAGVAVEGRVATDEEMVKISGNLLSAARPGDLAGLVHALDAYAHDKFR
jgi:hypothetical protein